MQYSVSTQGVSVTILGFKDLLVIETEREYLHTEGMLSIIWDRRNGPQRKVISIIIRYKIVKARSGGALL